MHVDRLTAASAAELATWIREGRVRSEDVVDAHIRRIVETHQRLNAVVRARFERAREEAREADRRIAEGASQLPPLHGVPCTIKECFALEGMPQTSGVPARRHARASVDATTVARLRAAGAIPLGVTNVSELCMWMESNNRVYGRTRNPYDHRRIVGGSSGGEGAVVGAGGSPFGLGSDIGGSIRMPAFFCGVFGHKPTGGLVPATGQHPMPDARPDNPALRYLTTGPIARRAEDLMPLLRILAGPDDADPSCAPMALGDPAAVSLEGMPVLVPDLGRSSRVHPDLREAASAAARALARRGARPRRTRLPGIVKAFLFWATKMADSGNTRFGELLGEGGRRVRPGRELARWATRRSPHTLPAILLAALDRPELGAPDPVKVMDELEAFRLSLLEEMGPGVLLAPSYTRPAPRHNAPLLTPFDFAYTALFNVLELPSTQVPLGLNRDGLPLGVQVVGPKGEDHRTIAVALALEEMFGGWVEPPVK